MDVAVFVSESLLQPAYVLISKDPIAIEVYIDDLDLSCNLQTGGCSMAMLLLYLWYRYDGLWSQLRSWWYLVPCCCQELCLWSDCTWGLCEYTWCVFQQMQHWHHWCGLKPRPFSCSRTEPVLGHTDLSIIQLLRKMKLYISIFIWKYSTWGN